MLNNPNKNWIQNKNEPKPNTHDFRLMYYNKKTKGGKWRSSAISQLPLVIRSLFSHSSFANYYLHHDFSSRLPTCWIFCWALVTAQLSCIHSNGSLYPILYDSLYLLYKYICVAMITLPITSVSPVTGTSQTHRYSRFFVHHKDIFSSLDINERDRDRDIIGKKILIF